MSVVLPFQLAGYRPDRMIKVGFPDVHWHQTADYGYASNHRQREVFMAVAMDLPDFVLLYQWGKCVETEF